VHAPRREVRCPGTIQRPLRPPGRAVRRRQAPPALKAAGRAEGFAAPGLAAARLHRGEPDSWRAPRGSPGDRVRAGRRPPMDLLHFARAGASWPGLLIWDSVILCHPSSRPLGAVYGVDQHRSGPLPIPGCRSHRQPRHVARPGSVNAEVEPLPGRLASRGFPMLPQLSEPGVPRPGH